ncbi:MAG: carboxypeptidase-like regulatory domain-containing protein, partial [Coriobacteriales bacterium]|nr:carboxypeptidase-like regulatory domain-containing protein [Coriobacteriales bacterium]
MHKGALRRDGALTKGLSVLCSVILAFGMTPATAFSQPVDKARTPVSYTTAAEDNIVEDADARAYLNNNFIAAGNSKEKFLSNGGDAVVKSEDGLTYTVPYKMTTGSQSVIDSLRFTYSQYDEYACSITTTDTTYLEAGSRKGRFNIVKRPEGQSATVVVTLRLYAKGTSDSDITAGTAKVLAAQDFNIVLEPGPARYLVTFSPVNAATGEAISGATVTVKDGNTSYASTLTPNSDGAYELDSTETYYVSASADGYLSYPSTAFTPTEAGSQKLELAPIVYDTYTFPVLDATSLEQIEGSTLTVSYTPSGSYSSRTVSANDDGTYTLQQGIEYTVVATAPDHLSQTQKIVPASTGSAGTGTYQFELSAITYNDVTLKAVDSTGAVLEGATVSVTDSNGNAVSPVSGTTNVFHLAVGLEARASFKLDGYQAQGSSSVLYYTPTGDAGETGTFTLVPSQYTVTFTAVDASGATIDGATFTVSYDVYDYWGSEVESTATVVANADGSFTLPKQDENYNKISSFTVTIAAPGYTTNTITLAAPKGPRANIAQQVPMETDPNQAKVEAIASAFNGTLGALYAKYGTYTNAAQLVQAEMANYKDADGKALDTSDVTVTLASSDDTSVIANDGTITFVSGDPGSWGVNSKTVTTTYTIACGNASTTTSTRNVVVGWDVPYFNTQMQTEADTLTAEAIKGSNASIDEVTTDLSLPQIFTTSARTSFAKVTWTSSNTDVIAIEDAKDSWGAVTSPKVGTVTQPVQDTQVTLTATIAANDSMLNERVEVPGDFSTVTKTFTVTVKGTGQTGPTEAELQQILDTYYTADRITVFGSDPAQVADLTAVASDLQLPRYTRIKDADGNRVFENKEITVTSDDPAITISGYRAVVDRLLDADKTVNLIVTFTRDGVSVSKTIPVTIDAVTDDELDAEVAKMEAAQAHYWDGINNNAYASKDQVTGSLHPFQEANVDAEGNFTWVYDRSSMTNEGIVSSGYFTDTMEMEAAGYNLFKSS